MSTRLVILDRDGVIGRDSDSHIRSSDQWHPIDGSLDAISLLTQGGFTVAVATNQSGIARGLLDLSALEEIHDKMVLAVSAAGGHIDRIVVCPHGPNEGCDCRKPAPGLLLQLADHYGISLASVPFIGDSVRDLAAAQAVGGRAILVRTGNGRITEAEFGHTEAVEVHEDLFQAARTLLTERVA